MKKDTREFRETWRFTVNEMRRNVINVQIYTDGVFRNPRNFCCRISWKRGRWGNLKKVSAHELILNLLTMVNALTTGYWNPIFIVLTLITKNVREGQFKTDIYYGKVQLVKHENCSSVVTILTDTHHKRL